MGIPSYYTQIIKNYKILQVLSSNPEYFYIDSNSIIYDIVNHFKFEKETDFDNKIIELTIQKLEECINMLNPGHTVIAFDGVAPFAKLSQQRQRRFKSYYQNKVKKSIFKNTQYMISDYWDTSKITPGTEFMKLLSEKLKSHFQNVVISTSDEYGEGEHKIFDWIRKNHTEGGFKPTDKHLIYGLDSDLIMISMMNLDIVPNIFLFRETPHYVKTIDPTLDENEKYSINISELSKQIMVEMGGNDITIIHDYVFISFMLGNDFLPHFPALNIRTGGIQKIISAYKETYEQIVVINRNSKNVIFFWDSFKKFITILSSMEELYIQEEFSLRERKSNYKYPENTPENKFRKFENTPSIDRSVEKHINPFKKGWELRYYDSLFDNSRKIENDYIQGLKWNLMYYTFGCTDWNWCYKHNYPPLIKDIVKYIGATEKIYWSPKRNKITQMEQLCYVLPNNSLHLIPSDILKKLKKEWYVDDCTFSWAFCKYFWECHVELPEINFSELRKLIKG